MNNILLDGKGNPWLTDKNEHVPLKCPICGSNMGLFLEGEPVFLCKGKDRHYYGTLKFDTEEMVYYPKRDGGK